MAWLVKDMNGSPCGAKSGKIVAILEHFRASQKSAGKLFSGDYKKRLVFEVTKKFELS